MWKHLPEAKINKHAWDNCVAQDPEGLIYALTWYLQAVAPNWKGWVYEVDNSYLAVIPVAIRRIAGLPVITQPLLTQQFGLFTSQPHLRSYYWSEAVSLIFHNKIPVEQYNFRNADLSIIYNILPIKERLNYILPLTPPYEAIKANYNNNRIRDIKKATQAKLQLRTGKECWNQVFGLYLNYVLPQLPQKQQAILRNIILRLLSAAIPAGFAHIYAVYLPNEQVVAGAFFLKYKTRLTYLLPAACGLGKKLGANSFLLDQVCLQYAGTNTILDLEGSAIPGIARFFKSFGAQPEKYGLLQDYNLSVPLKLLFKLKKIIPHFNF